ncbi:MAG: sigma-54-dependent Fis family transcriptional regulator [bacterium]|nr:sigma-54-dependent Fis family transcriptional regulator [bacterium]
MNSRKDRMKPLILVIDDEEAIRLFLESTLEDEGGEVRTAASGGEGLSEAFARVPDLVLLDLMLPDMSGLQVLGTLKEKLPHLCVIMLTAYREADSAVKAMKLEAFDYATKPIQLKSLISVVSKGLEATADARDRYRRLTQSDLFGGIDDVVPSQSPAMIDVYDTVRRISAGGGSTVLIDGESGVGKDVVANLIHRTSPRRDFPFLDVNCAALPENLLESELFGHEKGAFTDAVAQKLGLLELANGGTLFLDEIGEMALTVQVKLLRVLEKMVFRRVGGLQDVGVDVRIVAATNRNLASQVKAGTFREDLYYRLNVVRLSVPPLRARSEDILPLAEFFLRKFSSRFKKNFKRFDDETARQLVAYHWPGNIRELRNVIERAVLLEEGISLTAAQLRLGSEPDAGGNDLPAALNDVLSGPWPEDGVDLEQIVAQFEEALVRRAFAAANGNQSLAARLLRLNRDKFRYRLRQYGIRS